ncbi:putative aminoacyltransferase, E1 ubiquitin-activating enzyme [Rosa chinensis]|uniref:RING-type E3 ubiquitin transferase n=1 Tax=Rosa chinensis TaxID=74649 RepID=A0A2P6R2V5_ROSCH|nr:E3 ubiquitin-protein ligase MPSR1 [Rosa chinensis]PRQ40773.1 putative aminoacyltransferase, E1 ubiquitin-activating enzyme [Rosa chinensis]
MASDAAVSQFASFFDRLRRDRDLPPIIPFIMGLAVAGSTAGSDLQQTDDRRPERVNRLVVVNRDEQNMVVIESGSGGIDSLMRQLAKDGHPPASKASIAAMPTVTVAESGRECPICLDQFEVGGEAKEMPCSHLFHGDCVEKWLKVHGTCPVCRFTMPADEEEEPEKKNEPGISVSIFIRATSEESDRIGDSGDSTPSEAAADDDGDHMQS